MRRKDREITDPQQIAAVIAEAKVCRLAFNTGAAPYIVPLSYGYEDGTFYFHCAREGRKLELLARDPSAGFEIDGEYAVYGAEIACRYAAHFVSIIGTGTAAVEEDREKKRHALECIMRQQTGKSCWSFPDERVDAVAVIVLRVTEMSGKLHE